VPLSFVRRLGEGAFGDVWLAQDDLRPHVAVKFFRTGGEAVSSALDHARALARVHHPNVVSVFTIQRSEHPTEGTIQDCVVMQYLEGVTLGERLRGPALDLNEAKGLGLEIIEGMEAIHAAGLIHEDLHADNVMVRNGRAIIIDILYRGTLANLDPPDRGRRILSDVSSVRLLLQELIHHSAVDPAEAVQFNNMLASDSDLASVRQAWLQVTDPVVSGATDRLVNHAVHRLQDQGYVKGDAYAAALALDTPHHISKALLLRVVGETLLQEKHLPYLRIIAGRLTAPERQEVLSRLSTAIDAETPNGNWYPLLVLLRAFGRNGWTQLNQSTSIRLEHLIVNDVLAGRFNMYGYPNVTAGILGTHANSFWGSFRDLSSLVRNVESLLRQNWYTQNYVGEFFMRLLPHLPRTPEEKQRLLVALASAVRNDARVVVNNLSKLPDDWHLEVTRLASS
jgi:hypothetical protein